LNVEAPRHVRIVNGAVVGVAACIGGDIERWDSCRWRELGGTYVRCPTVSLVSFTVLVEVDQESMSGHIPTGQVYCDRISFGYGDSRVRCVPVGIVSY